MFTPKRARNAAVIVLAAAWCLAPPTAAAQSAETDVGELAALGGAMFGAGTQGTATGSAGVAFSRYGMALFETSLMPLGSHTIQPWPARPTVDRSYAYDFGVNFHIRVPVTGRLAPYGIVGAGLLWDLIRQHTVDSDGAPLVVHYDQFNAAFHTGAGLRYYVGRNWGIRPEVKVVISRQIYTQVTMGIFYVTPTEWP